MSQSCVKASVQYRWVFKENQLIGPRGVATTPMRRLTKLTNLHWLNAKMQIIREKIDQTAQKHSRNIDQPLCETTKTKLKWLLKLKWFRPSKLFFPIKETTRSSFSNFRSDFGHRSRSRNLDGQQVMHGKKAASATGMCETTGYSNRRQPRPWKASVCQVNTLPTHHGLHNPRCLLWNENVFFAFGSVALHQT